jgi:hypothetical protein
MGLFSKKRNDEGQIKQNVRPVKETPNDADNGTWLSTLGDSAGAGCVGLCSATRTGILTRNAQSAEDARVAAEYAAIERRVKTQVQAEKVIERAGERVPVPVVARRTK